jgi:hypothetical protein
MFMSSQDQGRSFKQVQLPFSTGANEWARQVGERLQVDPNLGNVLFYGTANAAVNATNNGLWKSVNGGDTWAKVPGFPALSSDDTGGGIAFLAFHKGSNWNKPPGSPTSIIYAAVNTQGAADSGATLFKSWDAGATWNRVWGAPAGMLPQRGLIGPDGFLYITFSRHKDGYGPGGIDNGQVWKVNILTGADEWTNITPTGGPWYGFVGLSVDPSHPKTVVVNSMNWYGGVNGGTPVETMYRTTDGGVNWTDIWANGTLDASNSPWNTPSNPLQRPSFANWSGSVLDPFDQDHAFISSGNAVYETKNLTQPHSSWTYGQNGIEESAPLSLISPTANEWNAYPLISGIGDICGFIHTDVNVVPTAKFANPWCGNTSSLDYAKNNSKIVVRVGMQGYANPQQYGAVSWNGGYSWNPFSSNGPNTSGGGQVAISTDGDTILWSNGGKPTVVSGNYGASWTEVPVPQGALITSDGSNATTFYAYERSTGSFYASYNKGGTWYLLSTNGAMGLPTWGDNLSVPLGKAGEIWVSTAQGLYRNTNWGKDSWTRMPVVESAKAVGFGKAAPGASFPAMYLDGKINGVIGIYRSIDTGASWVRIDSAQGQYGHAGYENATITGDPKVFGTVYLGKRGIMVGTSSN